MSGSSAGSITQWNDATGEGLVTEDGDGVHVVSASDCSSRLVNALRGRAIPPGEPVAVTFDLDLTNHAINVDLATAISLAASAEPMAVRSFAAPKKAAKKPAPKKKAARAPAKRAKKKSAGKKVAAKKSRKHPRKSAPKRRRR